MTRGRGGSRAEVSVNLFYQSDLLLIDEKSKRYKQPF